MVVTVTVIPTLWYVWSVAGFPLKDAILINIICIIHTIVTTPNLAVMVTVIPTVWSVRSVGGCHLDRCNHAADTNSESKAWVGCNAWRWNWRGLQRL